MRPYFEKMKDFGTDLSPGQIKSNQENVKKIKDVEEEIRKEVEKSKMSGCRKKKSTPGAR
mgnify:CR=1 FL=1